MDLNAITCEGADWIQLARNRVQWWNLVYMVMNLWVQQCGGFLDQLGAYKLFRLGAAPCGLMVAKATQNFNHTDACISEG